jgi:hypothetical protein
MPNLSNKIEDPAVQCNFEADININTTQICETKNNSYLYNFIYAILNKCRINRSNFGI